MTAPRPWRFHAANCSLLLTTVLVLQAGACTPVPSPPDDDGQLPALEAPRLGPGDRFPPIALTDVEGSPITNAILNARTTVLWFGAPEANQGRSMGEVSARVAEVEKRLLPPSRARFQALVLLVDPSADAAWQTRAQLHQTGAAWRIVALPHDQVLELAAACGVITWTDAEGNPQHNVRVLVIDTGGRIADVFTGLDDWTSTELLASVSQAMR